VLPVVAGLALVSLAIWALFILMPVLLYPPGRSWPPWCLGCWRRT
jgi:hypothetical protein